MRGHDLIKAAGVSLPAHAGGVLARADGDVLEIHAGDDLAACRPARTVVCHTALCAVDDLAGAVLELRRLVGHEGQLLFVEHGHAAGLLGRAQRALAPMWGRVPGGCHLDRDIVGALRAGGFVITDCERPAWAAGAIVIGRAIVRREP